MRVISSTRGALSWAALLVVVSACTEPVAESAVVPPAPPSTAMHVISVSPDGIGVAVGGTLQMNAAANFPNSGWTWSVSDAALGSISATGMVTAKKVGSLAVRACSVDNAAICGAASLMLVPPQ